MIVIGAGMAGLLAATVNQTAIIIEAGDKLPDNHKAVFRLRSNAIGRFTGIKMKEVTVHKAVWFDGSEQQITPRLANYYSMKVIGCIQQRSILNVEPVKRYVPPSNFVELLANKCKYRIEFGRNVKYIDANHVETKLENYNRSGQPIISTMPMPVLMKLILLPKSGKGMNPIEFKTHPIIINQYEVPNCDSYATIYYPSPYVSMYRATLDGNKLIIEGTDDLVSNELNEVMQSFGITNADSMLINEKHRTGKIAPIPANDRQAFIYNATIGLGIYSLGRYATWRPSILLDDIFDDIFMITKLIQQTDYEKFKYIQGE